MQNRNLHPSVTITVRLVAEGKNNFTVNHDVVYTISGDGTIKAENTVNSSNPQQVVARYRCQVVSR